MNLIFDTVASYGGRSKPKSWITLKKIQNKALQLINFKGPWESSAPLYKESKIFKLKGIVLLNNLQFVYHQINKNLPKSFHTFFTLQMEKHQYNTRRNSLNVPPVKITTYGSNSIVQSEMWTSYKINLTLNWHYLT